MTNTVLFLIKIYKNFFSPILTRLLGNSCRFYPTCSVYSKEAIGRFGLLRGGFLAAKRFLRCHPFSCDHYDPAPRDAF